MGRLQRKKPPETRKRKNREGGAIPGENSSQKTAETGRDGQTTASVLKMPATRQTPAAVKPIPFKQKADPGQLKLWIDKGVQFLREVRVELKKVAWPSRKQTIGSTAVVLILVLIIALFLGVVDFGLAGIIRVVLQ